MGGPPGTPDFVVQVLGDEGHMELSEKPGNLRKSEQWIAGQLKAGKGVTHRSSGTHAYIRTGEGGKVKGYGVKNAKTGVHSYHDTPASAAAAAHKMTMKKSMTEKSKPTLCKCGVAMKGAGCMKCGMKNTAAYSSEAMGERVGGPVNKGGGKISWASIKNAAKRTGPGMPGHKYAGSAMAKVRGDAKPKQQMGKKVAVKVKKADPWAIAGAAWKKVSPEKKKKYVSAAMKRHRKAGEHLKPGKYAERAPREFMERLARKSGAPLVDEFGHVLGGFLYKARRDIWKAMDTLKSEGKGDKDNFGHGHFDYIGRGDKHVVVNHADGKPKGGHKKHKEKMKKIAAIVAEKGGTVLSNNPTDAEIAKALMAGGGAGALTLGGTVAPPSYVHPRGDVLSAMSYGLPAMGSEVEVTPEAPAPTKPRFPQTVGGVQSAAWDLGIFNGNE